VLVNDTEISDRQMQGAEHSAQGFDEDVTASIEELCVRAVVELEPMHHGHGQLLVALVSAGTPFVEALAQLLNHSVVPTAFIILDEVLEADRVLNAGVGREALIVRTCKLIWHHVLYVFILLTAIVICISFFSLTAMFIFI